jgi:hypothetical protein
MKIVAISFVWNEIKFIKYKHEWAKNQGIDLYIIDNMSDDGTWEYLKENNIPSHRFDTNDSFNLVKLQNELIDTLHKIKPDWYLYQGGDEFFFTPDGLINDIKKLESEGYDSLSLKHIEIRNTGEIVNNGDNIFDVFNYCTIESNQVRIGKYDKAITITGDGVSHRNCKKIPYALLVNYGMTKSKEERDKTLERRQKAWGEGLKSGYGKHYVIAKNKNWTWDKNHLTDIRTTGYGYYLDIIKKYK